MGSLSDPLISVVVPTYRRPGYLREALGSIQAQTYGNFEVLVCDNDDSDQVSEIVEGLDSRFRHIRRPVNIGMLQNALEGFRAASGDFVIEVDDDDRLLPHCLEELSTPFAGRPDVNITFGEVVLIGGDGQSLPGDAETHIPARQIEAGLIKPFTAAAARGMIYMAAALVRRSAVEWDAVPPDVGTAYDRYIALAASRDGAGAFFVDLPLAEYRIHATADGVTGYRAQLEGVLKLLGSEIRHPTAGADIHVLRREQTRSRLQYLRASLSERRYRESLVAAAHIARHLPTALLLQAGRRRLGTPPPTGGRVPAPGRALE